MNYFRVSSMVSRWNSGMKTWETSFKKEWLTLEEIELMDDAELRDILAIHDVKGATLYDGNYGLPNRDEIIANLVEILDIGRP